MRNKFTILAGYSSEILFTIIFIFLFSTDILYPYNINGSVSTSSAGVQTLIENPTKATKEKGIRPETYSLGQNYPNPFNPVSKISYSIPRESFVILSVYNSIGEKIRTLVNEVQDHGNYNVNFEAGNLSSGIYFYSLEAKALNSNETFKTFKKMTLIK